MSAKKYVWGLVAKMLICGQVSSEEEANEIEKMAKLFIVGVRIRKLSEQSKLKK